MFTVRNAVTELWLGFRKLTTWGTVIVLCLHISMIDSIDSLTAKTDLAFGFLMLFISMKQVYLCRKVQIVRIFFLRNPLQNFSIYLPI